MNNQRVWGEEIDRMLRERTLFAESPPLSLSLSLCRSAKLPLRGSRYRRNLGILTSGLRKSRERHAAANRKLVTDDVAAESYATANNRRIRRSRVAAAIRSGELPVLIFIPLL
jgi:hypothetical protein